MVVMANDNDAVTGHKDRERQELLHTEEQALVLLEQR